MAELYRYIMSRFFGVDWVLIMRINDPQIKRVIWRGGRATISTGIRTIILLEDDGKTSGTLSYLYTDWEPYHPMSAKKYPAEKTAPE